MAAPKSHYRQLGGTGRTWTHYVRLYLGPDHLLQCASTGYSETYKRFYFRDIQAIIIRKSALWVFWLLFWLLPAMACALVAVFAPDPSAAVVLWVITGVLLLPLLANILLGPTCSCYIRTAVQTEKLPSLKRLARTRKLLAQLQPLIESVQGSLTADELAARRTPHQAPVTPTEVAVEQEITGVREAHPSSTIAAPPIIEPELPIQPPLGQATAPSEPSPSSILHPPSSNQ